MNPLKLLDPSYLFNFNPGSDFLYFWPLFVFYIIAFFSSWYIKKRIPKATRIYLRVREFVIIGLVLTFLRNENIPFFGMRFWTVLLFILAGIYFHFAWKKYQNDIEMVKVIHKKEDTLDKYLPRPKRKK